MYQNCVDTSLHRVTDPTLQDYCKTMLNAVKDCGMVRTVNLSASRTFNNPVWFNSKCVLYKNKMNRELRHFRRSNINCVDEKRNRYLHAKRQYCNLKKAKRTLFLSRIDERLST
jgi:hypothetical protein